MTDGSNSTKMQVTDTKNYSYLLHETSGSRSTCTILNYIVAAPDTHQFSGTYPSNFPHHRLVSSSKSPFVHAHMNLAKSQRESTNVARRKLNRKCISCMRRRERAGLKLSNTLTGLLSRLHCIAAHLAVTEFSSLQQDRVYNILLGASNLDSNYSRVLQREITSLKVIYGKSATYMQIVGISYR